jgi:hypothetical protein
VIFRVLKARQFIVARSVIVDVAEVLIETYRLMERSGKKPAVRIAIRFIRDLGYVIRNDRAYALLSEFSNRGEFPTFCGEQRGAQNEHAGSSGEQNKKSGERLRAHNKVLLVKNQEIDDSLRSSLSLELAELAPPPKKRPRSPKLPLADYPRLAVEREIENAIWERIGALPGRTKKSWRDKNIATIRDMLAAGSDRDTILTAHLRASERIGTPVHWLQIVQDQIARDALGASANRTVQGALGAGGGPSCGCSLAAADCARLHREENSSDRLPTIVDLETTVCTP